MTPAWLGRRAWRAIRRRPAGALSLVAAFALLALLGGAARLFARASAELVPRLADNVHVIVYLRDDVSDERAAALGGLVERIPGVHRVEAVSSEEAAARLRAQLGPASAVHALLDGVEEGFLPRSIEIALEPSQDVSTRALQLAERIRRIPGVAEVDAMEDGLARLRSFVGLLRVVGWLLFGLAVVAGATALAVPLSRGRQERAEEAEVLELLGETRASIRVPASLTGAAAALAGGTLGASLLYALFRTGLAALRDTFGALLGQGPGFLRAGELALGLVICVLLGWLVGHLSTPLPRSRNA